MADPDPPNEIHNRKSPRDGNVDAPNADAAIQQITDRHAEQQEQSEKANAKPINQNFWSGMLAADAPICSLTP